MSEQEAAAVVEQEDLTGSSFDLEEGTVWSDPSEEKLEEIEAAGDESGEEESTANDAEGAKGEDPADVKPETVRIGEEDVPVAQVAASWEVMSDVVASEDVRAELSGGKTTLRELAENGLNWNDLVGGLFSTPEKAVEILGHLYGEVAKHHGSKFPLSEDEFDLSVIRNPGNLEGLEKALYGAGIREKRAHEATRAQLAQALEGWAADKKVLAERENAPKLVQAVVDAIPGQSPSESEIRAAMKSHGLQDPVKAWKLEMLERSEKASAGQGRKAPGSVPKGAAAVIEFDPTDMSADEILARRMKGHTARRK